jgi:hypothetical protein
VGPRAGLDAVEKRKFSYPCRESNGKYAVTLLINNLVLKLLTTEREGTLQITFCITQKFGPYFSITNIFTEHMKSNCMELSLSEATSHSATQEFPDIL